MSLHQIIQSATLEKFHQSLEQYMPLGTRRDFYQWGTSPENPNRGDFIQMVGINQITNLSAHLLETLVEPTDWNTLAYYCGLINSYFVYEIVSDDLGIGLSSFAARDPSIVLKREILAAFNRAMTQKLRGDSTPATTLLEPIREKCQKISSFAQSMSQQKYLSHLAVYLQKHPQASAHEIEFGIWPVLVANVESCCALVDMMDRLGVSHILREGFINRYRDVSETLGASISLTQKELIEIGTHTVSVIPVLAYFTGVLTEIIYPRSQVAAVVEDGLLSDALTTAATIVRLLNDVGMLLTLPAGRRTSLIHSIWKHYQTNPDKEVTVTELISHVAEKNDLLTRLQKDILYGEFNVCLQNLIYTQSIDYGLSILDENLTYYVQLYRHSQNHLREVLSTIEERLQNKMISSLIANFVHFHERLYANRFNTGVGEYVA